MGRAPSSKPPLKIATKGRAAEIKALQRLLVKAGFSPGRIDGYFGHGTQAAVIAFQRSKGLLADGIAGPRTMAAFAGAKPAPLESVIAAGKIDVAAVSRMFPHTPLGNIKRNLPHVLTALRQASLHDRLMVIMALASVRAETESFEPVAEAVSRYNTSPNGHPFDLYDNRADLGNKGGGDGERFRGRGYVQLTGRFNYQTYGRRIGEDLIKHPDRACEPDVAARLLALFLADRERPIKEALLDWDFRGARRLVNGGSHGLERFVEAYKTGIALTA